ncbi:MAG TPA: hypothetical protein VNL13_01990 [Sulfolobales archaeon]|nr:hypothetical protein [Sulfolobales archaeon]
MSSILGLVRSRGHRQAYIASRVLVYSGFLSGFVGIYTGIVRLACYELGCPSPPITAHAGLLLHTALPLVIMGVGSLLSPAYYAYPPHGSIMITLSILGALYTMISLLALSVGAFFEARVNYALLSISSLLFSISNLDLFVKRKTKGFLGLMNIPFTLSSLLIAIYSLSILAGFTQRAPPWFPLVVFVIPMIFSVMLRTDPYTRKWYRENLSRIVFIVSMIAIASGFVSVVSVSIDSKALLKIALALLTVAIAMLGILLIPRKSGSKILREYEVSIKLSIPWGLSGLLAGLMEIPGNMDFLTHTLALGFVGNIFIAYSRFLLPYKPFTPGMMRALTLPIIVAINTGVLLRTLYGLLLYQPLGGAWLTVLGALPLLSSIIIGGALALIAIRILKAI